MNNWSGIGRITDSPELRKTQSGKSVISFVLAVTRPYKKNGTDFILITAWNQTADFMSKYVDKGDLLGVVGRIQTSNYDDKSGNRVYKTEVVADSVQPLESRKDKEKRSQNNNNNVEEFNQSIKYDITEEDLPFWNKLNIKLNSPLT